MPDLDKLPVPQYTGAMPYHWEYDNIPINVLAERDYVINGEVDRQSKILNDAAGTQGDVANRLNQSIDEDGNLKATAIDEASHNIAEHTDGSKIVSGDELSYYVDTLGYADVTNPVPFVRMLESERDKLSLIANEATNFGIKVDAPSTIVIYNDGLLELVESESIHWEISAPNKVSAVLNVSTDFAHRHFYDLDPITSDYKNYTVTMSSTPYIDGSLRIYINGVKLSTIDSVYYPSNPPATWNLNSFTAHPTLGTFVLDNAITSDDIISIDFDQSLT